MIGASRWGGGGVVERQVRKGVGVGGGGSGVCVC